MTQQIIFPSEFNELVRNGVINSDYLININIDEQSNLYQMVEKLKEENSKLRINLNTCKNDYWFMSTLLEKYSSNLEASVKDCIERMKFRAPLFNILQKEKED